MRFAAGWFSYLIERIPVLKKTAYILILILVWSLLVEDFAHIEMKPGLRLGITGITVLLSLAYYYLNHSMCLSQYSSGWQKGLPTSMN